MLTVSALLHRLDQQLAILTGGGRTGLPRQQTMRATVDWSFGLLSEDEQRFSKRLSVFSGGCTLESAALVAGDEGSTEAEALEILCALVDKSLVVPDTAKPQPRYRLLESFREYGRDRLEGRGVLDEPTRRHALAYFELAERFEDAYDHVPDDEWYEPARLEMDNWRAALEWSLGRRTHVELGQRLAGALALVWHNLAPAEGRRWIRLALELVNNTTPPDVVAHLEYADAYSSFMHGEGDAALISAQSALAKYEILGDEVGIARARLTAGMAFTFMGRPNEGEPLLRDALVIARRLGRRRLAAFILMYLVFALVYGRRDFGKVREAYDEAFCAFEYLGRGTCAPFPKSDFATLSFMMGDLEAAVKLGLEAVDASRRQGDHHLAFLSG